MRVEMLNFGWLTVSAGLIRKGEDMEELIGMPVPAFLVDTDAERILVDTGLHPEAVADPDGFYGRPGSVDPFALEQEQSIAEQVDLTTITRVAKLVLGGDVVHFAGSLDNRRLPLFGDDLDAQGRSAERLKALRDSGHTVIPSHDPATHRPGPLST